MLCLRVTYSGKFLSTNKCQAIPIWHFGEPYEGAIKHSNAIWNSRPVQNSSCRFVLTSLITPCDYLHANLPQSTDYMLAIEEHSSETNPKFVGSLQRVAATSPITKEETRELIAYRSLWFPPRQFEDGVLLQDSH
jgi:hypothetical protein